MAGAAKDEPSPSSCTPALSMIAPDRGPLAPVDGPFCLVPGADAVVEVVVESGTGVVVVVGPVTEAPGRGGRRHPEHSHRGHGDGHPCPPSGAGPAVGA